MSVYSNTTISTMPVHIMSVNLDPVHSGTWLLTLTLSGGRPPTLVPKAGAVLQPRMKGHGRFPQQQELTYLPTYPMPTHLFFISVGRHALSRIFMSASYHGSLCLTSILVGRHTLCRPDHTLISDGRHTSDFNLRIVSFGFGMSAGSLLDLGRKTYFGFHGSDLVCLPDHSLISGGRHAICWPDHALISDRN